MYQFLIIPGKPFPKERPRVAKGRAYTPKKTHGQEQLIQIYAKKSRMTPITGDVRLFLFFSGAHHAADLDNLCKLVKDALNGIAYNDDKQVVDLHAFKRKATGDPYTAVYVGPQDKDVNLAAIVSSLLSGDKIISS
tara:strand:- start:1004 stop:1411 length:408 start_codon:yes stop_codon:yes gene_type:complete